MRDALGGRLRLNGMVPGDVLEGQFEARVGADATLVLDEPLAVPDVPVVWFAKAGSLSVGTGDAELTVTMSEVMLKTQRSVDEPEVKRTVSGTISGSWVVEHYEER